MRFFGKKRQERKTYSDEELWAISTRYSEDARLELMDILQGDSRLNFYMAIYRTFHAATRICEISINKNMAHARTFFCEFLKQYAKQDRIRMIAEKGHKLITNKDYYTKKDIIEICELISDSWQKSADFFKK